MKHKQENLATNMLWIIEQKLRNAKNYTCSDEVIIYDSAEEVKKKAKQLKGVSIV